jgi:hypothetical protein
MSRPLWILIGTQAIYSVSDFMGRYYMQRMGFRLASFITLWFVVYQLLRQVAMFGQLYVLAHAELGRTMALLGASSIVISNVLGFLFLREVLSPVAYGAVALSVVAFLLLAAR